MFPCESILPLSLIRRLSSTLLCLAYLSPRRKDAVSVSMETRTVARQTLCFHLRAFLLNLLFSLLRPFSRSSGLSSNDVSSAIVLFRRSRMAWHNSSRKAENTYSDEEANFCRHAGAFPISLRPQQGRASGAELPDTETQQGAAFQTTSG